MFYNELLNFFKVSGAVLAKGTYVILGEFLTLVNISANFANVTTLALGFGLGLNVLVIVCVGHGLLIRNNTRLGNGANKDSVGTMNRK